MTTGTSHFESMFAAMDYYSGYGFCRADVERKVADGEINIGLPDLKPGDRVTVREGRYFIESKGV